MTSPKSSVLLALLASLPSLACADLPRPGAHAMQAIAAAQSSADAHERAAAQALARVAGDPAWSEQKVGASDGIARDVFGFSVAIQGDTALVGAAEGAAAPTPPPGVATDNGGAGAVYVFTNTAGVWTESAKLTADDGADNDQFGYFVALQNGLAVVGAPNAAVGGHTHQGAAYVFTAAGATWTQSAKLIAADGADNDQFGWSVALDAGTVAIGARGATVDERFGQGAVYAFAADGTAWTQIARLVADDGVDGDQLGVAVAVHGGLVLAGAPNASVGANAIQGAAYLFDVSGAAPVQTQKLAASDGVGGDSYGFSVAFDGAHALVSAPFAGVGDNLFQGAVYAYAQTSGQLGDEQKLSADDGLAFDVLGIAVALDGDNAVLTAPFYNGSQGKAYLFSRNDADGWVQQLPFVASDAIAGEGAAFGYCAAISGDTFLIGQALGSRGFVASAATYEGAAYFYSRPASDQIFADGFDGTP